MMEKHYYMIFGIISLMALGCGDNDLKEPVDVQFGFSMEPSEDERLSFDKARFTLSSFTFDGMRQAGDDVYFRIDYPEGRKVNISGSDIFILGEQPYDIPQGVYDDIEITFELMFFNNGKPSFLFDGAVIVDDDDEYKFTYKERASVTVNLHAMTTNGSGQIVLDKSRADEARISINPNVLFSGITEDEWEDAADDDDILIAADGGNSDLYSDVNDKMPNAFSLIID